MRKIVYVVVLMIVFTGCSLAPQPPIQKNIEKPVPVKQPLPKPTPAPEPINDYLHCDKHLKITTHAYTYVMQEFDAAYLQNKDTKGAQAQLFLIETNSPTSFATNINAAQASYQEHYTLAKKNGCDLSTFKPSALKQITQLVLELETKGSVKK